MTSFARAPGDPGERDVGRGQPKEYQRNSIICRSASPQANYVSSAGASRFKGEAVAGIDQFIQALDHQQTRCGSIAIGVKWRNAARDFVCIYELADVEGRRQPSDGPRGLAGAVGSTTTNNVF